MPNRISKLALSILTAGAFCAALIGGCQTGSEIPNELRGRMVDANGKPVAGAVVVLYAVDALPGSEPVSADTVRTDASGSYAFPQVAPGNYNVIATGPDQRALRDSVSMDGNGLDVGTDTLRNPGSLVGRIVLQPKEDPRKALIQVLGTDIFVNVDADGYFRLEDMAEGKYRLRLMVGGYTPLYQAFRIRSGREDTLAQALEPFFVGIPMVTGLKGEALADGSIRLSWNAVHYADMRAYGVFREPADAVVLSGNAMALVVGDTVFTDTVYSANPRPDPFGFPRNNDPDNAYGGQFPIDDTTAYRFRYRVVVYSKSSDTGTEMGEFSDYVFVTARPPAKP